jgi:exonuclease V
MFNAKIMDAGSVIHHRLEKEIHPVEVKVDVTTREERWALRLLNMLAAVEALLELGICVRAWSLQSLSS